MATLSQMVREFQVALQAPEASDDMTAGIKRCGSVGAWMREQSALIAQKPVTPRLPTGRW